MLSALTANPNNEAPAGSSSRRFLQDADPRVQKVTDVYDGIFTGFLDEQASQITTCLNNEITDYSDIKYIYKKFDGAMKKFVDNMGANAADPAFTSLA